LCQAVTNENASYRLASFPLAALSFGPSVEGDFDALRDRPRDPEAYFLLASSQEIPKVANVLETIRMSGKGD